MLTVQYLLESAFCLSCLYALYWLLLRRETFFQWNRAYLLLAPVLACLAPALHIRIAASMSPAAAAPAAGDLMPAPLADLPQWVDRLQTAPRLVGQALEQPLWSLTLGEALRWVYGVVAAFFMLHLLAQVWRLLAFLRRCKRTEQAGVVLATGPAGAPLASFFGFVFWHPGDADDSEQRLLFEHEMVHVRQWHSLDLLLMEMLIALQWFNPLLYVYRRSLRAVHEYIADDYVVRRTRQRYAYARLLAVRQATGNGAQPGLVNTFHSCIKNRLIMLAKRPSSPLRRAKYLLALPLLAALLLLFSFRLVERLPTASPLVKATQTLENYSARLSEVVIAGARIAAPEPSPYRLYWGPLQAQFEYSPAAKIYEAEIFTSPEEFREALKREPRLWNGKGLEQTLSFQCRNVGVRSDYNNEDVYDAVRTPLEILVTGLAKDDVLVLENITLPEGKKGVLRLTLSGEAPKWLPRERSEIIYQADPGRGADFFEPLIWHVGDVSTAQRQFFTLDEFWTLIQSTPHVLTQPDQAPRVPEHFNLRIVRPNGEAFVQFSDSKGPYTLDGLRTILDKSRDELVPGAAVWITAVTEPANPTITTIGGPITRVNVDTIQMDSTIVVVSKSVNTVFDLVGPNDPRQFLQRADMNQFKIEWGNYATGFSKMYARSFADAQNRRIYADRPRAELNHNLRKKEILQMLQLPLRLYRNERLLNDAAFSLEYAGTKVSAVKGQVPAAFLEKLERELKPGDVLKVTGLQAYTDPTQLAWKLRYDDKSSSLQPFAETVQEPVALQDLSTITLEFEVRSDDPKPPLARSAPAVEQGGITLSISPNPVHDRATVQISLPKDGSGLLTVTDVSGVVQYSLKTDFHAGTTPFRLPMNQIKAKGALFLRLEMPYGSGQAKMVVE